MAVWIYMHAECRDGILGPCTCTSVHFYVLVLVLVLGSGVLVPIKIFLTVQVPASSSPVKRLVSRNTLNILGSRPFFRLFQ